jgi:hypothetical protein
LKITSVLIFELRPLAILHLHPQPWIRQSRGASSVKREVRRSTGRRGCTAGPFSFCRCGKLRTGLSPAASALRRPLRGGRSPIGPEPCAASGRASGCRLLRLPLYARRPRRVSAPLPLKAAAILVRSAAFHVGEPIPFVLTGADPGASRGRSVSSRHLAAPWETVPGAHGDCPRAAISYARFSTGLWDVSTPRLPCQCDPTNVRRIEKRVLKVVGDEAHAISV